jgi:hypothetical protein
MVYEINLYENCTKPRVKSSAPAQDIFTQIRTEGKWLPLYEEAKKIAINNPESYKQNERYQRIKKSLPAVTWNFTFSNYKKTQNIQGSTGLLYFDLDNNLDSTDQSLVYARFRSLSNLGAGILVKVSGLTVFNFKNTCQHIATKLGINFDKQAAKPTQFNAMPYDPNITINEESVCFEAVCSEQKGSFGANIQTSEGRRIRWNNYDNTALQEML